MAKERDLDHSASAAHADSLGVPVTLDVNLAVGTADNVLSTTELAKRGHFLRRSLKRTRHNVAVLADHRRVVTRHAASLALTYLRDRAPSLTS